MRPKRTTLLLLLVVASAAAVLSVTAQLVVQQHRHAGSCVPQEKDALLAFKRGITSDPAGRLASWQQGDPGCCRWRGVRCSNLTGRVVGIHLRNVFDDDPELTALAGQISPSLLSLQHLEHLDLSVNNISGTSGHVPEFLGLLENLRYLNLSSMSLSGRVPPHLGNLSKLHYLDLSYDFDLQTPWDSKLYSTDISWLSNLPLRYLDLGYVDLTSADWAHAINMVPSLKVLHLPGCFLRSANQSIPQLNLTDLVELSLPYNYLGNPIASCWFWSLTNLQHLDLAGNELYSQIPDALINLCNLEILDLSYNEINGSIVGLLLPQCSSNKLKEMRLGGNSFTGVLPSSIGRRWSSLLVLELFKNQLTGPVPSEIGMLNNLLTLDLSDNRISGPVPFEVSMLSKLTKLYLGGNNLNGVITHEHLAGLKSLKAISLSSNFVKILLDEEWMPPFRLEYAYFAFCQMGPQFPAWLRSQTDILELDISSAHIFDRLPEWFWTTVSNAQKLDISNNSIHGILPKNMDNMKYLESLFLNSNQITGPIPLLPTSLQEVDISRNSLSGPLALDFRTQNLEYLSLASNLISGPIPESICQFKNLITLNLANNLFEGEFPSCFQARSIHILVLHHNSLSGKFPSVLKTCRELIILDLSWNKFSGRLPMWIGNLSTIEVLQLGHNLFYGTIPAAITRLGLLSHLNLAGNSISGALPPHLSNLSRMATEHLFLFYRNPLERRTILSEQTTHLNFSVVTNGQERYYGNYQIFSMISIDLSDNHLTGRIPEEIASLKLLVNLNLSRNYLSGKIPIKIGAMQSLESLDLSQNKLCGQLPQGLSNLKYLSYLDLSDNNLTRRIP